MQAPPAAQGTAAAPVDLTGLVPYNGEFANPGSFYVVGGLVPGVTYRAMIYNITNDATLFVYSDATFTTQLCTSNRAVNLAEDCSAAANGSGKLYIKAIGGTSYVSGGPYTVDVR